MILVIIIIGYGIFTFGDNKTVFQVIYSVNRGICIIAVLTLNCNLILGIFISICNRILGIFVVVRITYDTTIGIIFYIGEYNSIKVIRPIVEVYITSILTLTNSQLRGFTKFL